MGNIFVESSHHHETAPKVLLRHLNDVNSNIITSKSNDDTMKSHSEEHSDNTHSAIGRSSICFELIMGIRFVLGVTLILGFVFMLIIDNCSARLFHHHGSQGEFFSGRSLLNFSFISSRFSRFSDYHKTESNLDSYTRVGCTCCSGWNCSWCCISNQSIQY